MNQGQAVLDRMSAAERAFCNFWWNSERLKATAGELLQYAERSGLDISGKSIRARRISLGHWLTAAVGTPIKSNDYVYDIARGKWRNGCRLWLLTRQVEVTSGKSHEMGDRTASEGLPRN